MSALLSVITIFSIIAGIVGCMLLIFPKTRLRGLKLGWAGVVIGAASSILSAHDAWKRPGEHASNVNSHPLGDKAKAGEQSGGDLVKKGKHVSASDKMVGATYVLFEDSTNTKQVQRMNLAKEKVRNRLRDPESAEFRNVYLVERRSGITVTCGEVNSKNAFGGYAGFENFISNGGDISVLLSDFANVTEFRRSWEMLCR